MLIETRYNLAFFPRRNQLCMRHDFICNHKISWFLKWWSYIPFNFINGEFSSRLHCISNIMEFSSKLPDLTHPTSLFPNHLLPNFEFSRAPRISWSRALYNTNTEWLTWIRHWNRQCCASEEDWQELTGFAKIDRIDNVAQVRRVRLRGGGQLSRAAPRRGSPPGAQAPPVRSGRDHSLMTLDDRKSQFKQCLGFCPADL